MLPYIRSSLFSGFACATVLVVACSSPEDSTAAPDGQSSVGSAALGSAPGSQGEACYTAADCRGQLPLFCRVCPDGQERCSHYECQSGQCVAELCPTAPAAPECTTAADCHGPLPQLCERCPDGTDECAHYVCEADKCVVQICSPPVTTTTPRL
jgi:hypothetical protein